MVRQWPGRHETAADGLLAVVLLAFGVVGTAGAAAGQGTPAGPAAYGLVAVAALALAVRRRWPLATLAVAAVSTSAYLVLGYPYGPILISFCVAVYTVAARQPVRRAALACGVALAVLLVHAFGTAGPGLVGLVPGSAWVVVPFALGVMVRLNREAAARARQEQARRLADEERLRIAQEVHDVVGHGLTAINMQAEIALHLLAKQPEQAEKALTAISRSSKEALDELRVTLGALRRGDADRDERAPAGLAQLEALRSRLAAVGLPVTVITGTPQALPVAVDLAAYRVVQEALTNVLRHGGGAATVTVVIDYAPTKVTVEVTDTGRGASAQDLAAGDGHGLAGMRERVTALGGLLEAGPRPDGGFRVYAELPTEPRP